MFEDFIIHSLSQNAEYKKLIEFSNHFYNHFKAQDLTIFLNLNTADTDIDWDKFLIFWNKTAGKDQTFFTETEKKLIVKAHQVYGKQGFAKIVLAAKKDSWHIETKFIHLTVEFLCKEKNLQKYSSYKPRD
jgi:hypothetical protein